MVSGCECNKKFNLLFPNCWDIQNIPAYIKYDAVVTRNSQEPVCFKQSFISKDQMIETVLFLTALVVTLNLNSGYATPTDIEEEFSYCTENVTSCRVTITELYDATDDVLNVFDELCNETDLVCLVSTC